MEPFHWHSHRASIYLYRNSRGVTGLDSGSLGKFGPNDLRTTWYLSRQNYSFIASFTLNLFMFKVLNYLLIFSITFCVFLAVSVALLISFYTFAGFPPRWSLCSSLMMLRALLGDLCAQEPTMVWRFLWSHSVEGWPINVVNDGQHHRAISQIWRHADMYSTFFPWYLDMQVWSYVPYWEIKVIGSLCFEAR